MHEVNGVVWKNRGERWWAHFLLEYTEAQQRWLDLFDRRKR